MRSKKLPAPFFAAALVALVLALMLASAGCAVWLTWQAVPELHAAELREAEDAAFSAGRVTAMAEMSEAMAQVYEQGRQEALQDQARAAAKATVRGGTQ